MRFQDLNLYIARNKRFAVETRFQQGDSEHPSGMLSMFAHECMAIYTRYPSRTRFIPRASFCSVRLPYQVVVLPYFFARERRAFESHEKHRNMKLFRKVPEDFAHRVRIDYPSPAYYPVDVISSSLYPLELELNDSCRLSRQLSKVHRNFSEHIYIDPHTYAGREYFSPRTFFFDIWLDITSLFFFFLLQPVYANDTNVLRNFFTFSISSFRKHFCLDSKIISS